MARLVWDSEWPEPRHIREDWTVIDERLAIWDEEENGHVMFPPGGRHRKVNV